MTEVGSAPDHAPVRTVTKSELVLAPFPHVADGVVEAERVRLI
jgi:hypothetical protein